MWVGHKPKRCCSPEGRVALPESLWHLLQVLVSVGFKLHIFKRGRVIRISMNTKHNAVYDSWVWLQVQNVGARVGNVGSPCRRGHKKQQTHFRLLQFECVAGRVRSNWARLRLYCSFEWTLSRVRYSQHVCCHARSQGLQSTTMQCSYPLHLT